MISEILFKRRLERKYDNDEYRIMDEWENSLFLSIKKGDFSLFKKSLNIFDTKISQSQKTTKNLNNVDVHLKNDLNQPTLVERWVDKFDNFWSQDEPDMMFTAFSFICFLGRQKMFDVFIKRKDVKFGPNDFSDIEKIELKNALPFHHLLMGKVKGVNDKMFIELYKRYIYELDLKTTNGLSFFSIVCKRKKVEIFKEFLKCKTLSLDEGILHDCASGDIEMIKTLLQEKKKLDINGSYQGMTPLCVAAKEGNLKVVKYLIGLGSNANIGDIHPLYISCKNGHEKVIYELLKIKDINVSSGVSGAIENGNLKIIKHLLSYKSVEKDINEYNSNGYTCLHAAVENNNLEIVKLLLSIKGIDVNKGTDYGTSPLYYACECNYEQIVQELLKMNCNFGDGDENPLNVACENGYKNIVKLLLKQKNVVIDGKILDNAILSGSLDIVKLILSCKLDEKTLNYPIYYACQSNNHKVLQLILSKFPKINVNLTPREKQSGFFIANQKGYWDIVMYLLKQKSVNVNLGVDHPIVFCCIKGKEHVLDEFLKRNDLLINNGPTSGLFYSVKEGNVKFVKKLLKHPNIDVNKGFLSIDNDDYPPLYPACREGHIEIVKLLLSQKDIKVNKGNFCGLFGAVQGNHVEIVKILIEHKDINPNIICGNDCALFMAAVNNNMEIFDLLLGHKKIDVNVGQHTALVGACKARNVKMINKLLVRKDCDVNKGELSPLFVSCQEGDENIDVVKALLKREDIDVNCNALLVSVVNGCNKIVEELLKIDDLNVNEEYHEKTALIHAIESCNMEVLKLLLLKRKDINVNKGLLSPLHYACMNGNVLALHELLNAKGIEINKGKSTPTPLWQACQAGSLECVKLLLQQKKIDVNKCLGGQDPPLYMASREGHYDICKELLKRKDIDVNNGFYTALYGSCEGGNIDIVKMLLERVDVDIEKGQSLPFYACCRHGDVEIVKLFLKKDIDINKENRENGLTALYGCADRGNVEIVKLLIEKYKDIDINKGRLTPLYGACMNEHLIVVQYLLGITTIDVNKGAQSPLLGAIKSGNLQIVKLLLKQKDIIIDNTSFISSFENFSIYKELLKVLKDENSSFVDSALENFCKEDFEEREKFIILTLQRNVKFNEEKLLSSIEDEYVKNIIKEFLYNKSAFRHKYGSMAEYDIGIKVREYYKCALIIGNRNYNSLTKLKTCENDGKEMAKLLRKCNFSLVSEYYDADCDDMYDSLDEFIGDVLEKVELKENKYKTVMLFFYFGGHGLILDSQSLLLPCDFKKKYFNESAIKNVFKKCLTLSAIKATFSCLSQRNIENVSVIILDSCRTVVKKELIKKLSSKAKKLESEKKKKNGKVVEGDMIKTRGDVGDKFTSSRENIIYCFATEPNSVAFDSSVVKDNVNKNNSPFTISLIENFSKSGNFENVLKRVRNKTLELTAGNQCPWISSSLSFPIIWNDESEMKMSVDVEKEYIYKSILNSLGKIENESTKREIQVVRELLLKLENNMKEQDDEIVMLRKQIKHLKGI